MALLNSHIENRSDVTASTRIPVASVHPELGLAASGDLSADPSTGSGIAIRLTETPAVARTVRGEREPELTIGHAGGLSRARMLRALLVRLGLRTVRKRLRSGAGACHCYECEKPAHRM